MITKCEICGKNLSEEEIIAGDLTNIHLCDDCIDKALESMI